MLLEYAVVAGWYENGGRRTWIFDEVRLGGELIEVLSRLDIDMEFYDASIKFDMGEEHCYIPSQYLGYAVRIKPLALLLRKYLDVFEKLQLGKSDQELAALLSSVTPSDPVTDWLDSYSRDCFYALFKGDGAGAGKVFESDGTCRSIADIACSVVLDAFPSEVGNSRAFGRFIFELSCKPEVYERLESVYHQAVNSDRYSMESDSDILYRLFAILDIQDNLERVLPSDVGSRYLTIFGIEGLFLLSSSAVAGNSGYFEEPVAFLDAEHRFVHLKKGVLDDEEGPENINAMLEDRYPSLRIEAVSGGFSIISTESAASDYNVTGAVNRIYYGAPGTGKSYRVDRDVEGHRVFRTVFHLDTQYSDFAGGLRPRVGSEGIGYEFRPGPFTLAYIDALKHPDRPVFLIIEEINRAPAASVFGEVFQLLDRDRDGRSIYSVEMSDMDMAEYIASKVYFSAKYTRLRLPSNLSILATMNSSDQGVMPMDTAFKRRWLFEYMPIDYSKSSPGEFSINIDEGQSVMVRWRDFAEIVNDRLIEMDVPEDRLLGQRFLSEQELTTNTSGSVMKGKLLVYLWDDVLRHGNREQVFKVDSGGRKISTFGGLISAFENGSPIFSEVIEQRLAERALPVS